MKQSKKIAFVVTVHWSEKIRPKGQDLLSSYLSSIYDHCKYDFHIFIIDNESEWPLQIPDDDKCTCIRIDDQYKKGLTGAWNIGLFDAYCKDFDILINCNDDLRFDDTINKFIETIIEFEDSENVVFCPLTNGVLENLNPLQLSNGPKSGIQKLDGSKWQKTPNGFMFGMTKEHYVKYRFKHDEYFNKDNKFNRNDGKWGGQEGQWIENRVKGSYGIIVNECFVRHIKFRAWQIPLQKERGK